MKAIVIPTFGSPEVLEWREVADPCPGPEEVLVAVKATAMNRADLLQRRGRYPAPPGAPADIPGLEFAGVVEQVGPRVLDLKPGMRVMGILGGGGHAEKLVTHERLCLPVPERLGWEEAAAVPEAFLTAFDALFLQGELSVGETVLIPAAASGVGTAALQMAQAAGARVIALTRSPDKRARLLQMGAIAALDPAQEQVVDRIRRLSGGGVQLVLELVGASNWPLAMEALATRGRMILVGTMGGNQVQADLGLLMRKRLRLLGTVLRSRPLEEKIAVTQAFLRRGLPLLAAGTVSPVIERAFPLSEAAAAHAFMEANRHFGKILLTVGPN